MSTLLACVLAWCEPAVGCVAPPLVPAAVEAPAAAPAAPAALAAPAAVVIATSRGESVVPVHMERGHPVLAAARLSALLPLTVRVDGDWAVVSFGGQPFRFLLGAGLFLHAERLVPLTGGAYLRADTVFVPLQWLADYVPRVFSEGYRYDPLAARFEEAGLAPVVRTASVGAARPSRVDNGGATAPARAAAPPARTAGPLRFAHNVVIDAGHGGDDPGNPGLHFPPGVREKDVTLALAKQLRGELERRGITVLMTRTTDVLVDLQDRAKLCAGDCDLFISLHVNSLPRRSGYQDIGGFETYFLGQSGTAEADRVAAMENAALRYQSGYAPGTENDPLGFILKDLHTNEFLRESAALADAVQRHGSRGHPGGNRGVSQHDRFVVLRLATRPAILVETGFSTNRRDARFLASPTGQRQLAKGIADGIVEYLVQYERKISAGGER